MKSLLWWVILLAAMAGIAAAVYHYYWQQKPALETLLPQPSSMASPPAPQTGTPTPQTRTPPRHPIGSVRLEAEKPGAAHEPLPPLRESDTALRGALAALFSEKSLVKFFYLKQIVHRVVATIDNLPRTQVSQRLMPVKPPRGRFLITREGGNIFIDPNNYRRYTPYVQLAEAVDTKKLVAVYVHFYPLFQQAYEGLGYPKRYFNDRLIEVIDNLLATPDVRGPIKLVRPNVVYRFANPELEGLSAGQKLLIRMGSRNAAKIKTKLREIRRLLRGEIPKH